MCLYSGTNCFGESCFGKFSRNAINRLTVSFGVISDIPSDVTNYKHVLGPYVLYCNRQIHPLFVYKFYERACTCTSRFLIVIFCVYLSISGFDTICTPVKTSDGSSSLKDKYVPLLPPHCYQITVAVGEHTLHDATYCNELIA